MGRKTKYKPKTFPRLVGEFARDGYSDKEIWKKLGIGKDSFYLYLKKYPEFSEALYRNRVLVNAEVEEAYLKRALGYDYDEVTNEVTISDVGKETKHKRITTKTVVPDVRACAQWLECKKPEIWRKKQEIDVKLEGFKSFAEFMLAKTKNETDN